MQALDATDLGRIARFLGDVAEIEGDEAFPSQFLAALRRLVPCDYVAFSELDRARKRFLGGVEDPRWDGEEPEVSYWDIRHEHPVCHYQDMTGDFRARRLSDFVTSRALRRSRIYIEWFRPGGVEHELCVGLDAPMSHTKVFLFDRTGGSDFTEGDRAVLDAIRPHLAARYEAAQTRRRLQGVLALLEQADAAVVLVDGDDRIDFATDLARTLLDECFDERGDRVPAAIANWRRTSSEESLTVECDGGCLDVRASGDALLLKGRPCTTQLTPREREILELVAEGLTNAEIAERLWLSPGTVRRHLENVYGKLGVHTRTAAAAAFVRHLRRA